ncbi:hypothetical protein [Pseudomonas sp. PH1b]|uniref:hypothetical protein n=1 Tax=Pseudomonas sp. PH1b TaxID=1397282 RepID=UPI00046837A2|nr:hypothetical protein [Pseudomonas sp. PH1b]
MSVVKVGKYFRNVTMNPARVVKIVDPAENTHGLIIQTGLISPSNGALGLYSGTSAPSGIGDESKPIIFAGNGNTAAGSGSELLMPNPLFVSAGQGLWVAANVPAAAVALTWDLLD